MGPSFTAGQSRACQAQPPKNEADAAQGSYCAEPLLSGYDERIKGAAENEGPGGKEPASGVKGFQAFSACQDADDGQHHRMDEVIVGGCLPGGQALCVYRGSQAVSSERAEADCEGTHNAGQENERAIHGRRVPMWHDFIEIACNGLQTIYWMYT